MPFDIPIARPRQIGIVGSRRRNSYADKEKVKTAFIANSRPGDIIVSGGCSHGADKFAEEIAKELGLSILIHYPDWRGKGMVAGILRNTNIAADCDILIAAVAADRTGGTEDTIKKAEKLGKKIVIV